MAGGLARWEPFADMAELRARFDRLLDEFSDRADRDWIPAIDVVREDGKLVLRADVPGIRPDEVRIEVEDDVLTVSGKHEETTEETGKEYVRRERRYGAFSRSISLPQGVDPAQISATTRDGVLEVTVPLPERAAKGKITITPTGGE